MLQVTNRAIALLREERSQQGIPDHFGIRVLSELDTRTDPEGAGLVLREQKDLPT
jgi:hypothetical protein